LRQGKTTGILNCRIVVKRISRRKFLLGLGSTAAVLWTDAMGIEPGSLRVTHFKIGAAPKHRFVHFTDVHHKGDTRFLQEVVDRINAEKPEFVCFTGDLIEEARYAAEALEILEGIKAPLYGVPGNHDYWAELDFDLPRDSFAKGGGQWLMNQEVIICGGEVVLFGMSGVHHAAFQPRVGARNILVSHYPTVVESFPKTRFDLVLAGHTHGGQVRLPGYGALIVPFSTGEYQLGMYDTPAGPLYVNAGIGYFFANVRFCCRPEITVFEV
jgi:uncharacterized protein